MKKIFIVIKLFQDMRCFMERKNKLLKNFLFVLTALFLLGAGFFAFGTTKLASAIDVNPTDPVASQNDDNDFLLREEFSGDVGSGTTFDGLISENTFLYSSFDDNYLRLSLPANGQSTHEIYKFCYYPDPTDISHFYFFSVNDFNLEINGQKLEMLNEEKFSFRENTNRYFENQFSSSDGTHTNLYTFEMNLAAVKQSESTGKTIGILDEYNSVIEGLYTLNMNVFCVECIGSNGNLNETAENFQPEKILNISYSFYVADRASYTYDNLPLVENKYFDKPLEGKDSSNPYSYILQANFQGKKGEGQKSNEIPYIEYDYTRFDLSILKEFEGQTSATTLKFNKTATEENEEEVVVQEGHKYYTQLGDSTTKIKVYFSELGEYSVTLNPIQIVSYGQTKEKYSLNALKELCRPIQVSIFGYQAAYTNYDLPNAEGSSETYATSILATPKFSKEQENKDVTSEGYYDKSADITGWLLTKGGLDDNQFIDMYIIQSINGERGDRVKAELVKTNQAPIKFLSNATLKLDRSYILSTNRLSTSEESMRGNYYRSTFNGSVANDAGTYIYILAYTYQNYHIDIENTDVRNENTFYQVFYFEITKELDTISITTEDGMPFVDDATNKTLCVTNTTLENIYNRQILVQLYRQNFNNAYVGEGEEYGTTLLDKETYLTQNGIYTIKLFYKNEGSDDTHISSSRRSIVTYKFIIDTDPVSGITISNLTSIGNGNYMKNAGNVVGLSTNQSIALSWNEKSHIKTHARFRKFDITEAQFYNQNDNNEILTKMLRGIDNMSLMPVNYVLDLTSDSALDISLKWKDYTNQAGNYVFSESALTDSGLYLFDIFDDAGNHTFKVVIIDYSKPIFAAEVNDSNSPSNGTFELCTPTISIQSNIKLWWGRHKAIYIKQTDDFALLSSKNKETITDDDLKNTGLFTRKDGVVEKGIYEAFYDAFHKDSEQYFVSLVFNNLQTTPKDAMFGGSYNGSYLTLPINNKIFYTNDEHKLPAEKTDLSNMEINVTDNSGKPKEDVYVVMIRDNSNTMHVEDAEAEYLDYTNFYSAMQRVSISFDASAFSIRYKDGDQYSELLSTNTIESSEVVNGETHKTLTTYLAPTNLEKAFSVRLLPESTDKDNNFKVESLTINYYEFVEGKEQPENSTTYFHWMTFSKDPRPINFLLSTVDENGWFESEFGISGTTTAPGKYEIERTYSLENGNGYNKNQDYYKRKFVLVVDDMGVVSDPQPVDNDINGTSGKHRESLVGGDIFVSMYDNNTNSDLVVSFPDSVNSNKNGTSLFNSGNPIKLFTTNKLPVNIYVPAFKFTKYVQFVDGHYVLATEADMNKYYTAQGQNTQAYDFVIQEYTLYAEIYRDDDTTFSGDVDATPPTLIARTSQNPVDSMTVDGKTILIFKDGVATENGFLKFNSMNGESPTLTTPGNYFVRIYQGFGTAMQQAFVFQFEIKKIDPDFEIRTSGNESELNSNNDNVYFTNESVVTLQWDASQDNYMADIDRDNIKFSLNGRELELSDYQNNGQSIWAEKPSLKEGNRIYSAKLNLASAAINTNGGVYYNGGEITITMQYENHNDNFYNKVSKTIRVDLSAPYININKLVQNTIDKSLAMITEADLREYHSIQGNVVSDLSLTNFYNVSYNTSNTNGNYAYYSYFVTKNFLSDLLQTTNTLESVSQSQVSVYARKFGLDSSTAKYYGEGSAKTGRETSAARFTPTNFTKITSSFTFEPNNYYEIVEEDLAGNRTIYTIFVKDEESETNIFSYLDGDGEQQFYTTADFKLAENNNISNNIYSKEGFELQNINFFGDAWAQFTLTTRNEFGTENTYLLMLTPLKDKLVNLATGELVSLQELVPSTRVGQNERYYKTTFKFVDKLSTSQPVFNIGISNLSISDIIDGDQSHEYRMFAQPSNADLQSDIYVSNFLTKIKITIDGIVRYGQADDFMENKLGIPALWQSNNFFVVTTEMAGNKTYLKFALRENVNLDINSRILYEAVDNFGNTYSKTHLFRAAIPEHEFSTNNGNYIYSFDENGEKFYIVKDDFRFTYNASASKVEVQKLVFNGHEYLPNGEIVSTSNTTANGLTTISIKKQSNLTQYLERYAIIVSDSENADAEKEIIKVVLYNGLPTAQSGKTEPSDGDGYGEFVIVDNNNKNITREVITQSNDGYYSRVVVRYTQINNPLVPVKYLISNDRGNTWKEIESGEEIVSTSDEIETFLLKIWYDTSYLPNANLKETTSSNFVFEDVPAEQIYTFRLSSQKARYWIEKTEPNGEKTILQRAEQSYKAKNGQVYANHYIVNLDYNEDKNKVVVQLNDSYNLKKTELEPFLNDTTIEQSGQLYSAHWRIENRYSTDIPYSEDVIISFVPNSTNITRELYTYNLSDGVFDTKTNLINYSNYSLVVDELNSLNKIELKWSKYYGIEQNEININLTKDGIALTPIVRTEGDYKLTTLEYSGRYTITLSDISGNRQMFNQINNQPSQSLSLVLLKDVPFTVTYTNPQTHEQETSLPVKQAIYNGTVRLDLVEDNGFYNPGGGNPQISVKRNGASYTENAWTGASTFYFTQSGYYEVSFNAKSPQDETIRKEEYQFTIIDPEENKISYVYNKYSDYYVERVLKDGTDITEKLVQTMDVEKVLIDGKAYLTRLPLSYLDDKTGQGKYLVTVNTNNKLLKNSDQIFKFTFAISIKTGTVPIRISTAEGNSTTGNITVVYDRANLYAELGNSTIKIVRRLDNGNFVNYVNNSVVTSEIITSESTGEGTLTISGNGTTDRGTFFVQIESPSGNLLFSYKVVRTTPMNAATIIAIVIASVVLVVVVFLIFKLRKKISVK